MALTEEQINERLEEVKKVRFTLDADPVSLGLSSLNVKISEVQAAKDRVSTMVLEGMKNVAELEIIKETVQNEYDRQLELLLVTDASCLAAKSAEARNVAARIKIPEKVMGLHHADINLIKGQWFLKCLTLVHSNLESANSNLSRQITVVQIEQGISSGNNFQRGTMKEFKI